MRLNDNLKLRTLGGYNMIVAADGDRVDLTVIYTLNDTAAWLWNECKGRDFSEKDMADMLVSRFDVSPETALADAARQIAQWKESGLVI